MILLSSVSEDGSYVAEVELAESLGESVGEPATDLLQNIPLVVVAQSSGDLVIGHLGTIAVFAPEGGKGLGVVEAEESLFSLLPRYHVFVLWLLQDSESELPQLSTGGDIWRERERGGIRDDVVAKTSVYYWVMCYVSVRY